jgi:hypothetical protein
MLLPNWGSTQLRKSSPSVTFIKKGNVGVKSERGYYE